MHCRRRSIDAAIAGDHAARDVERSWPTRGISLGLIRDVAPATLRGSRRLCLYSNGAFGSALRPPHDAAHRGAIACRGTASNVRELAMFSLAIDSKLWACDRNFLFPCRES